VAAEGGWGKNDSGQKVYFRGSRIKAVMMLMMMIMGLVLPEYSDDFHQEEDVDNDDNDDRDGEGCRYLSILMTPTRKRMLTMMTIMTGMARDAAT
jgi:hypothetical protein